MARGGAMKLASAAVLLLVLLMAVTTSADADADAAPETTASNAAAAGSSTTTATGRRGAAGHGGRYSASARPMGLTQCVTGCGSTVTSCLLQCYRTPSANRVLLPVCLLDCTNDAMFCAADCSTNALN